MSFDVPGKKKLGGESLEKMERPRDDIELTFLFCSCGTHKERVLVGVRGEGGGGGSGGELDM